MGLDPSNENTEAPDVVVLVDEFAVLLSSYIDSRCREPALLDVDMFRCFVKWEPIGVRPGIILSRRSKMTAIAQVMSTAETAPETILLAQITEQIGHLSDLHSIDKLAEVLNNRGKTLRYRAMRSKFCKLQTYVTQHHPDWLLLQCRVNPGYYKGTEVDIVIQSVACEPGVKHDLTLNVEDYIFDVRTTVAGASTLQQYEGSDAWYDSAHRTEQSLLKDVANAHPGEPHLVVFASIFAQYAEIQ